MNSKIKSMLLCFVIITTTISYASAQSASPSIATVSPTPAIEATKNENQTDTENAVDLEIPSNRTQETALSEMEMVSENEKFQLYIDNKYLTIAIKTKATGSVIFSNPIFIPQNMQTSEENKADIFSLLNLVYYNKNFESKTLISWSDCVSKGQFIINKIDNGMEIVMTLGEASSRIMVPMIITEEAFNKIMADIPAENQVKINRMYKYYNLEKAVNENQKQEWLKLFPSLTKQPIYALKGTCSMKEKKDMEVYFKKAGLTFEEIDFQYKLLGYEAEDDFLPSFKVPVKLSLDKDGLICEIDSSKIEFDKEKFYLYEITLLKYLGAGFINDEKGYMLIPDGSGALVNYTGLVEKSTTKLSMKIFGTDISDQEESTFIPRQTRITLPVFGNKNSSTSFIASVEEGSAMGYINTQVANKANPMNTSYASFIFSNNIQYVFDEYNFDQNVTLFSKKEYQGKYTILYMPIVDPTTGYVGMAKAYRQRLIEEGKLPEEDSTKNKSLYLELLGSIKTEEKVLGFPIKKNTALTSFENAGNLLETLKNGGIESFVVQYKGWANGGLDNTVFNKIKIENSLGGKKQFDKLNVKAEQLNADMFFDTDFMFVNNDVLFDGFSAKRDSSRNLIKNIVGYSPVNYATNKYNNSIFTYSVSPGKYMKYYNSLINDLKELSVEKISLSNIGRFLYSDYRSNAVIDCETALDKVEEVLKSIPENYTTLFENGNSYVFPYADYIMKLPTSSNGHLLEDDDVPFLQMVISGKINYSSNPINLSSSARDEFLKSLETGSNLCYVLVTDNYQKLKSTKYSDYYSVNADSLQNEILLMYKEFTNALGNSIGTEIINHEVFSPGVRVTTYADGKTVIVNYNDLEVSYEGGKIQAKSFIIR